MSSGGLTVGPHAVTATASGPSGTGQLTSTKTLTITGQAAVTGPSVQPGGGQEIGYVDQAGDANAVPTLPRGGTLYVRGWAVDTAGGAPVQNVTVFVDGSPVGTAALGSARPDVAQAFSRSDYTNSGWSFQMSSSGLTVGPHSVTATASGSSGTGQLTTTKTVTITAQ